MQNSVDNEFPFLDVLINLRVLLCLLLVCSKNSFAGVYIPYNSYSPMQQRVNLISCLTYRALTLCSKEHLDDEILNAKNIVLNLANSDDVIYSIVLKTRTKFEKHTPQYNLDQINVHFILSFLIQLIY